MFLRCSYILIMRPNFIHNEITYLDFFTNVEKLYRLNMNHIFFYKICEILWSFIGHLRIFPRFLTSIFPVEKGEHSNYAKINMLKRKTLLLSRAKIYSVLNLCPHLMIFYC